MFERDYNEKYNFYKSDFQNECDYLDFDSFSSFIFMRENKWFNDGNNIPFEPNYLNTKINDTTDILKTKESGKELSVNNSKELFFSDNGESKDCKIKEKKNCVRKRNRESEDIKKKLNKYSDDSLRRNSKNLVLESLKDFMNELIRLSYHGNIGDGPLKKELKSLDKKKISNSNVIFNQNFLNKTIFEIFSEDISGKITNHQKNHNKLLINQLINEENENIKYIFNQIVSLKFSDCMNHFIGKKHIGILNGLKCYKDLKEEIIKKYEDGEEYSQNLEYYLNNFEEIINKKKARNSYRKHTTNISDKEI